MRRVQVFEPHEIHVAEELIEERLAGSTDYLIYVADEEAEVDRGGTPLLGFVCHGHNPVTDAVHDIYWTVVDPCARRCRGGRGRVRGDAISARRRGRARRGGPRDLPVVAARLHADRRHALGYGRCDAHVHEVPLTHERDDEGATVTLGRGDLQPR